MKKRPSWDSNPGHLYSAPTFYQQNQLEWYPTWPFTLSYAGRATITAQDGIFFLWTISSGANTKLMRKEHRWNWINLHNYWKIFSRLGFNIIFFLVSIVSAPELVAHEKKISYSVVVVTLPTYDCEKNQAKYRSKNNPVVRTLVH